MSAPANASPLQLVAQFETPAVRSERWFWLSQGIVWPAYAASLMIPWLGRYPVALMLPNKLVVALSGIAVSSALRFGYQALLRRSAGGAGLLGSMLAGSFLGGFVWDAILSALLGGSHALDLHRLGSLGSGIPQLSGAGYHGLLLLAWSLGYVVCFHRLTRPMPTSTAVDRLRLPSTSARLVLRDGRRSVVLRADEVDWIEAAGDYVRVHLDGKRILLRSTLTMVESALPSPDFVRIHRSTIVQTGRIRELVAQPNRDCEVILRDGTRLRASRTYAGRLSTAVRAMAREGESARLPAGSSTFHSDFPGLR